jgi:hypothetical protein
MPKVRTPERQRLAEAIRHQQTAAADLQKVRAARAKLLQRRIAASDEIGRAEKALTAAQKAEPARRVAALVGDEGDPVPDVPTLAAAEADLASCRAAYEAAKADDELLAAREANLYEELRNANGQRDSLAHEIAKSSPELERFRQKFIRLRIEYFALEDLMRAFGYSFPIPLRGSGGHERAWKEQIAALRSNPDAPLPDVLDAPAPEPEQVAEAAE